MNPFNSKIHSVLTNTCPSCPKGQFFVSSNPYKLKSFGQMNPRCPVCNEDFERETGFYYGAMYVSYGLTVGLGIVLFLISHFLIHFDDLNFIWVFPIILVLLTPPLFRYSRLIWINLFVKTKTQ